MGTFGLQQVMVFIDTMENRLPNITGKLISVPIFSILEDRKGNFWFGTYGSGAYYYDGKSFQNFTTRDGLANNRLCLFMKMKPALFGLALEVE
jgi:ligand-binding sensor domain-containing protein